MKYIERLNYNNKITIKLVIPSSCNAHCQFCYMNDYKDIMKNNQQEFLNHFIDSLNYLLKKINNKDSVSLDITGNEPTFDIELLIKVLNMLKQYNIQDKVSRVTFTTNGFNLLKVIPYFKNVINYVNISMHHYNQEERNKIFKTNTPSNYDYKLMVDKLADIGIKTSSTCVTYKSIENFKKFMNIYISFCKEIGFVSVRFRDNVFWKDSQFDIYMNLALNDDQFEVIQCENTSDSKWCRLKMKDKFRVFFLHGVKDTSSVSKGIEYVIADDGKCYTDFYKKESIENYKLLIGKIYDIK